MTRIARHRGFTLIEVLLATFVIALGVLGLLALFAGAARQQQASTNETAASFAARGAEGALDQAFGTMQSRPPAPECPPNTGTDPFPLGVWRRLEMDPNHYYLSINSGGGACGPYFLVGGTSIPLYQAPPPPGTTLPFPGPNGEFGFMGSPSGAFAGSTFWLPHRRIDPLFLRLEVVISKVVDDGSGNFVREPQPPMVFERRQGATYLSDLWPSQIVLTRDGLESEDPDPAAPGSFGPSEADYFFIDPQLSTGDTAPARVTEMGIGAVGGLENDGTSALIDSVRVLSYKWRNSQLVSLNDRTQTRADPSGPDGRRADRCYSVLYRRTASGSQAMVMAYQLTATSSTAKFVPPETLQDIVLNASPIKRVSMSLHRDQDDPQQQYFRVSDERDLWAIAPGQVLLIAGDETTTPIQAGSDKAVKVIRQVREGGQWRGYVDRMPRILDHPAVPPGQTTGRLFLNVYGIADTVESRADGSTWKLTPLLASEFQVDVGN